MTDSRDLARLAQFDTPTVCNVIELFDVRPRHEGFLSGDVEALFPELPPVVGHAATATFASSRPESEGASYSNFVEQVEHFLAGVPEPRIVVFQDVDSRPVGATFGEVMCSTYQAFGCLGLITSGGGRDLDQVRRLGFPCWASSVISSHAYCRIVDVGVPVTVGGCEIRPGDLLHGDANGVTTIPEDIAGEVARGCQLLVEAENEVIHYDRSGRPTVEGLREARRRSGELMGEIAARLRREKEEGGPRR